MGKYAFKDCFVCPSATTLPLYKCRVLLPSRLLDGLSTIEGYIVPSTPPSGRDGGRYSGSAEPSEHRSHSTDQKPAGTAISQPQCQSGLGTGAGPLAQPSGLTSHLSAPFLQLPAVAPTLAFFLQLPPVSEQSLTGTVLAPSQPPAAHLTHCSTPDLGWGGKTAPSTAEQQHVLRLTAGSDRVAAGVGNLTAKPGDAAAAAVAAPRAAQRAVLLLTFDSPATTHAALAQLHALALASEGRAALAALQPVP